MQIKLEGLKALEETLAKLPRATAKNVVTRVLNKAASPIDEDASTMAPRDFGGLERSVITGKRLTSSQRTGGAVRQSDGSFRSDAKNYVEVHVGTALPRGQFLEFGTFKDAPQPFMRPAWESNKGTALGIIKLNLAAEIEKSARRYAKKLAKGG